MVGPFCGIDWGLRKNVTRAEYETFQWVASYQLVHDAHARDFEKGVALSNFERCARMGGLGHGNV